MTMNATTGGDPAWLALSGDLRRYIRSRVSGDDVADDLLQETFLRVHRGIAALSSSDRLAPWVYAIARNVVYDHHRRGRSPALPLDETEIAGAPLQEDSTVSLQAASWLDAMMARLPDGYRMALQLAEIDGLSHKEVAGRLGLTLTAAKSRVRRGRARLRAMLEACCTFEFDRRGNVIDYARRTSPSPEASRCTSCGEGACAPPDP